MKKLTLLWIIAALITLSTAYYQRLTGPTYPVRGKITVNNEIIKYKLLRSANSDKDALMELIVNNENTKGVLKYKRYNTHDEWTSFEIANNNGVINVILPKQPPAGKLLYEVNLISEDNIYKLSEKPIVIRFKGPVPAWALIPHILFMFAAMLVSNFSGLIAIFIKNKIRTYVFISALLLFIGGMIFGPIIQKYAFGDYWTGIPFGWDLTDNKTLIAMIAWAIAVYTNRKNSSYKWALIAAIITIIIYLIPHSLFGSELDYATGIVTQG